MTPIELLRRGIGEGVFPGAAAAWGDTDGYETLFAGRFTYDEASPPVREDSLFDLASLTKVVATTTRVQDLVRTGRLDLDAPLPFRSDVTARQLLSHTAGLPACRRYEERTLDSAEALAMALAEPLEVEPGERVLYCDVGFILLGHLVEILDGPLASNLANGFCFRPEPEAWPRCLPTGPVEPWRRRLWEGQTLRPRPECDGFLQGEVHDPRAALLGGIAGHAGLFGTLEGVAEWAKSRLDHPLDPDWATPQSPDGKRGLGWDLDPGGLASIVPGLYGHTGFTGTLVVFDPHRRRFAVLLTNRLHPSAESLAIRDFRRDFISVLWA